MIQNAESRPDSYPTWIYFRDGAALVRNEEEFLRAVRKYDIGTDEFTFREWADTPAAFSEPAEPLRLETKAPDALPLVEKPKRGRPKK
jgi:hypothetical protein